MQMTQENGRKLETKVKRIMTRTNPIFSRVRLKLDEINKVHELSTIADCC